MFQAPGAHLYITAAELKDKHSVMCVNVASYKKLIMGLNSNAHSSILFFRIAFDKKNCFYLISQCLLKVAKSLNTIPHENE